MGRKYDNEREARKKEKATKILRFRPLALAVSKSTLSPGNLFSYPRFKDGRKGVYFFITDFIIAL